MKYTVEQKQEIIKTMKGRVVECLEYDDIVGYWIMEFTDGTEFCFRFMAEES